MTMISPSEAIVGGLLAGLLGGMALFSFRTLRLLGRFLESPLLAALGWICGAALLAAAAFSFLMVTGVV